MKTHSKFLIPTRVVPALAVLAHFHLAPLGADEGTTGAQDLPAVIKSIEELERKLTDGVSTNNARALRTLEAAVASPKATLELFLEATRAVDYEAAGKSDADWREWRDRNEVDNKSTEHLAARQIQLRYLVVCLRATLVPAAERAEARNKVLADLAGYLDELAAKYVKLNDHRRVLDGSAMGSVFARHLKLDITFDRNAGWPDSPSDVPAIYERIVLPVYRETRDLGKLMAAWDKRIAHEGGVLKSLNGADGNRPRAGGGGGGGGGGFRRPDTRDVEREREKEEARIVDEAEKAFREFRLPDLRWERERDGLLFGADKAAAYAKLTQLLGAHLDHPSAKKWLEELKRLADGTYRPEREARNAG